MTEQRWVAHGLVQVGDNLLLLHRREGRYLGGEWDLPGGTVEYGESPAAAVVRECVEETGLECGVGHEVSHFENMDTGGRDINFHTVTFRLVQVPPIPRVLISDEHQDFRWLALAQALELPLVWHVRRTLTGLA